MSRDSNKAAAGKPPSDSNQSLGRIRDYDLLAEIGQGGMGTVYLASHTMLKRKAALKLLPQERMADEPMVSRFLREIEAVGKLRHENIVQAFDAGEENGTYYFVMEYVHGWDLSALLKQLGPLPVADACELIRQAAVGLQHAHEHGLVHRDIKPSNLMVKSRRTRVQSRKVMLAGQATIDDNQIIDSPVGNERMIYRGTVKRGVVELEEGATLPDGTQVKVEPLTTAEDRTHPRKLGTLRGKVLFMALDFDAQLDDFKEYMQ